MYSFDKSRRLLKKIEYDHVFNQAEKLITSEFIMLYRQNTLGHARLGLALSKKKIAKAHDRNRIKRLLRETFRTRQLPAIDIVILAKNNMAKATNLIIINKLSKAWDKLTMLCGK